MAGIASHDSERGSLGEVHSSIDRPDAIVVDLILPDCDGLDLCDRLRRQEGTATTPLIVLTGDDGAFDSAAKMRSIDAILKKPRPRRSAARNIAARDCDPRRAIANHVPVFERRGEFSAVSRAERSTVPSNSVS